MEPNTDPTQDEIPNVDQKLSVGAYEAARPSTPGFCAGLAWMSNQAKKRKELKVDLELEQKTVEHRSAEYLWKLATKNKDDELPEVVKRYRFFARSLTA